VYKNIAASADSETVKKMGADGIVQHASFVRMLSNQRAVGHGSQIMSYFMQESLCTLIEQWIASKLLGMGKLFQTSLIDN
jgi:hypothetical protein